MENNKIVTMTRDEAIKWKLEVFGAANQLRIVLFEGYSRNAWEALGYNDWSECIKAIADEFQFSERHLWRLHAANRTEVQLTPGSVGQIPEKHIRPLTQLPPDQQSAAWHQAVATAPDGKVTAAHVESTVKSFVKQSEQAEDEILGVDEDETELPFDDTEGEEQPTPDWLFKKSTEVQTEPTTYQIQLDTTTQPFSQSNIRTVPQIEFYTVDQWNDLPDDKRKSLLETQSDKKFNSTNENVEWAMYTWNPVTGCLHNCSYCYARDIAQRFYNHVDQIEDRFQPMFYPDRLTAPSNTKIPDLDRFDKLSDKIGHKSVFVCSMADLWGKWVPAEWIEAVLEQVRNNPQWNFIFLTKFPIRMSEFEFPKNTMVGTTVDSQFAVERAEKAFRKITAGIKWLSCEPMMERLTFTSLEMFDWVVCGGASRSTQTPEFRPPREWVDHLRWQAKIAGCTFYEKTNLGVKPYMNNGREDHNYIVFERERSYPWDEKEFDMWK